MKLFLQKFRALGAPPPDPQTAPPQCEFLATRLVRTKFTKLENRLLKLQVMIFCTFGTKEPDAKFQEPVIGRFQQNLNNINEYFCISFLENIVPRSSPIN